MKRIILHLFIMALLSINLLIVDACYGQWVNPSNNVVGQGTVYSLAALGNDIFAGTYYYGVYKSTNNGINWLQTTLSTPDCFSFTTLGNNIFVGTDYNSGIFLSSNSGTSWAQVNNGLSSHQVLALKTLGVTLFAGTYGGGIFQSTNNGSNWTSLNNGLTNLYVRSIAVSEAFLLVGTYGGGIFQSTNNGTSWNAVNNGLTNLNVYSLAISGPNLFAGTANGVYLSTNNGANWTQKGLFNLNVRTFAISGINIFAGLDNNCGVYLTTNNGTTWIEKNEGLRSITAGTVASINSLLISNNFIYAATQGRNIYRASLMEIIGVKNINGTIPRSYSLSQNYPNPFNPITTIKFSIPKLSLVKITVFDITGKELETLVNEKLQAGTYLTKWEALNFSSSMFLYKIQTEDYTETKRMVLIK